MEINKQLFEDILSGKLKGTFVLRNGKRFSDDQLTDIYKSTVVLGKTTYYFNGKPIVSDYNRILDIIEFIPETNMKENELNITIPEGQEIDWQESAKQEKIVFKKKENTKPRSWEEYRAKVPENKLYKVWGVVEGEELAEAFIAMMQLMSLRQAWIGDWKPDWNNFKQQKVCILCNNGEFVDGTPIDLVSRPLSFPTKEMARDFMNCFKDLLNTARPLI